MLFQRRIPFGLSCYIAATLAAMNLLGRDAISEEPISLLSTLQFDGLDTSSDLSAVEAIDSGETLFVVSDEAATAFVLRRTSNPQIYQLHRSIELVELDDGDEADFEALAIADGWVYVAGSHSRRRKQVKSEQHTVKDNRRRMLEIDREKERRQLLRISIESLVEGDLSNVEHLDLHDRIEEDKILGPFSALPSKENGVDIEGLAVSGKRLFLGLRGPVLRGGYACVIQTKFDEDTKPKLRFVNLRGLGIRALERVKQGFLILGGPISDGPGGYSIFFWDGKDGIPGTDDLDPSTLISLGPVPCVGKWTDAKPEGLSVVRTLSKAWEVIVVHDGPKGGHPILIHVPIPTQVIQSH